MSYVLTTNPKKAMVWPSRKLASGHKDLSNDKVKVVSSKDHTAHHLEVVRNRQLFYVKAVEVLI